MSVLEVMVNMVHFPYNIEANNTIKDISNPLILPVMLKNFNSKSTVVPESFKAVTKN